MNGFMGIERVTCREFHLFHRFFDLLAERRGRRTPNPAMAGNVEAKRGGLTIDDC
jgi:hypothetical protein